MTSTTTRIFAIALAILAVAAPVAGAAPIRDGSPRLVQDHSRPDTAIVDRVPTAPPPAKSASGNKGPSPLVYILPSLTLLAMLGAATVYVRASRRPVQV